MNDRTYRLIALNQNVHDAIQSELSRRAPSAVRLLRLKLVKAWVRRRLEFSLTRRPRTVAA